MIDPHYSRALDEIYRLRAALAREAQVVETCLDFATLPVTVRKFMEKQVPRMRAAARGEQEAYADMNITRTKAALASAGASETLTRVAWEDG